MIRDERGAAALELAIVAPALMLLVVGVLQLGLLHHAQLVIRSAAQEGARLAAAEASGLEEGERRAQEVLSAGLGRMAEGSTVRASGDSEYVRVQVETRMRGLLPIPGLSSFHIAESASVFAEHFRPAGSGA